MRFINPIIALSLLMILVATGTGDHVVHAQDSLSPPTGVTAVDGDSPGEVKLTWNAVPDANYYRVGWVDYADYLEVTGAGLEWLEAFVFVDVSNRGQTSYTVPRLEPGAYHAFIVGSAESRFGTAQWSEWAALTLRGAPSPPPTDQPQVPSGATILAIPVIPTVECHVGLRISPGQGCIWPEPEPNPLHPSGVIAYQRVSQGGDYAGQFITTWDDGKIWISAPDRGVRQSITRGRMNLRYRFWADREDNNVWVVTKVNEAVEL